MDMDKIGYATKILFIYLTIPEYTEYLQYFQVSDHSMLCFVMVGSNFNMFFPCPLFGCIDCDPNNPGSEICVNNKGLLMPHVP